MASISRIPELLDGLPSAADLDAVAQETRNREVSQLLSDILQAKEQGLLRESVCLYCPFCDCLIQAGTRRPEPIHRCGTVLEVATCACCQLPATHFRTMEEPSTNSYAVEAWADRHSHKGRA